MSMQSPQPQPQPLPLLSALEIPVRQQTLVNFLRRTGTILLLTGFAGLGLFFAKVFGSFAGIAVLPGRDDFFFYMGATAGSLALGWGAALRSGSRYSQAWRPLIVLSSVAFAALSAMRIVAAFSNDIVALVDLGPLIEAALFAGLAFLLAGFSPQAEDWTPERGGMKSIMQSFFGLPKWVVVWVNLLGLTNMAAFFMLETLTGKVVAAALLGVMVTNLPIAHWAGGMNRLMSLSHLVMWLPLELFLIVHVLTGTLADGECLYALTVIVVNGISLGFDVYDGRKWLQGERETL